MPRLLGRIAFFNWLYWRNYWNSKLNSTDMAALGLLCAAGSQFQPHHFDTAACRSCRFIGYSYRNVEFHFLNMLLSYIVHTTPARVDNSLCVLIASIAPWTPLRISERV